MPIQRAPAPQIQQVPPGPSPGTPAATPPPVTQPNPALQQAAAGAMAPAPMPSPQENALGNLSPEQLQIVEIALQDPQILAAIAQGISSTASPDQVLFG